MARQSKPDTDIDTNFELNDTLYARASIAPADAEEVYLWLGANVMLSYPIAEAEDMLRDKVAAAERSLANCEEDLEFLREQVTVWCFPTWLLSADNRRRWRSLPLECITGMWCSGGKKRPKGRETMARTRMRRRGGRMVSWARLAWEDLVRAGKKSTTNMTWKYTCRWNDSGEHLEERRSE